MVSRDVTCDREWRYFIPQIAVIAMMLVFAFKGFGQAARPLREKNSNTFNPRDFSGVWWVSNPSIEPMLARAKTGDASKCETCHIAEHAMPEPPLTPWASEHLLVGSSGQHADSTAGNTHATQRNNCDPIGVPAQFWYVQLHPFEFVVTRKRIFQFFENHREWRTIGLNRDHPKNLESSYMGDSVANWDGNTLVVDTIGYNGKDMVEPVGVNHLMSNIFHLVERWRRVSLSRLDLDATYYDSKVWGDKPWGGLHKEFVLQPNKELMESPCIADENAKFDKKFVLAPSTPSK